MPLYQCYIEHLNISLKSADENHRRTANQSTSTPWRPWPGLHRAHVHDAIMQAVHKLRTWPDSGTCQVREAMWSFSRGWNGWNMLEPFWKNDRQFGSLSLFGLNIRCSHVSNHRQVFRATEFVQKALVHVHLSWRSQPLQNETDRNRPNEKKTQFTRFVSIVIIHTHTHLGHPRSDSCFDWVAINLTPEYLRICPGNRDPRVVGAPGIKFGIAFIKLA